jgi:hypothetical protein
MATANISTQLINMRTTGQDYRKIYGSDADCMTDVILHENAQQMIDASNEEYDQDEINDLIEAFVSGTKAE